MQPRAAIVRPERDVSRRDVNHYLTLYYDQLRALAKSRVARCPPREAFDPAELVHEAYLDLMARGRLTFVNRRHFFYAANRAMRNVVVDRWRRSARAKRGAWIEWVSLDVAVESAATASGVELPDLERAMDRLKTWCPTSAEIVRLRCQEGLTMGEVAHKTKQSLSTVRRRWRAARARLDRELRQGCGGADLEAPLRKPGIPGWQGS